MDPYLEQYLADMEAAWARSGLDSAQVARLSVEVRQTIEDHARTLVQRGITGDTMRKSVDWHRENRRAFDLNLRLALTNFPGPLVLPSASPRETRETLSLRDSLETALSAAAPLGVHVLRSLGSTESARRPPAEPHVEAILLAGAATNDFIEGVVDGVEARLRAVDSMALISAIRAAFTTDDYGFGVAIGLAWGGVEEVQSSLQFARWVMSLLLDQQARAELMAQVEDVRAALVALATTLRRANARTLAYQAGRSIGAAQTLKVDEAFLALAPDSLPPMLQDFWPSIQLGRLLSPIFWTIVSIVAPELSVGSVAARVAGPYVRRLGQLVLDALPDRNTIKRAAQALRRAPGLGRPNIAARARRNAPRLREDVAGVSQRARGLEGPENLRASDARNQYSSPGGAGANRGQRLTGQRERALAGQDATVAAGPPNPAAHSRRPNAGERPRQADLPPHPLSGEHGSTSALPSIPVRHRIANMRRKLAEARVEGASSGTAGELAREFWNLFNKLDERGDTGQALRELFERLLSTDALTRGTAEAELATIERLLVDSNVRNIRILRPRQGSGNRTPDILAYLRRRPSASRQHASSLIERVEVTTFVDTIRPGGLKSKIKDKVGQLSADFPGAPPEGAIVIWVYDAPSNFASIVKTDMIELRDFLLDAPEVRRIEVIARDGRSLIYRRGPGRHFFRSR